jgi:hypothetical protein
MRLYSSLVDAELAGYVLGRLVRNCHPLAEPR